LVRAELELDPATTSGDVAYLAGARHCRALSPLPPPPAPAVRLREGGTYLVTGGAGGIGLLLAQHLTSTFGAQVVLLGRTELSAERKRAIEALSEGRGRALYVRADVTRYDELRRALRVAKAAFKRLDGVFHCAGVTRDGYIARKTLGDARETLGPKI